MKKVGPCNFGAPQLKKILKKVLVWPKINVFRAWTKNFGMGTFRPPKVEKSAFFGIFFEERRPESKNYTPQISLRIKSYGY